MIKGLLYRLNANKYDKMRFFLVLYYEMEYICITNLLKINASPSIDCYKKKDASR